MLNRFFSILFVFLPGLLLLLSAGCKREVLSRCAACVNGQCGAYSERDTTSQSLEEARKLYCQQFRPNDVATCRLSGEKSFDYDCKDYKYEWGIRFPLAPK